MPTTLIFVNQEYDTANHRFLWNEMASQKPNQTFIILNISADFLVSFLKRKTYRVVESKKGIIKIKENLFLARPLFFVRPEITPSLFFKTVNRRLLAYLKKQFPFVDLHDINALFYEPFWAGILKNNGWKLFYYLFDEVRLNADSGKTNKKRFKQDMEACRRSEVVFAMSNELVRTRKEICKKIVFIGNGCCKFDNKDTAERIPKSAAIIGNLRSWIDTNLLREIVKKNPDISFYFIGNIEKNMKNFFNSLSVNKNVYIIGPLSKNEALRCYTQFSCILVPYIQNYFIYCSRPLKIVESIFSGTPVATVPISGYSEKTFIKFCKNEEDFSNAINYFNYHPIDKNTVEFNAFVNDNSWESVSEKILWLMEISNEKKNCISN